MKIKLQLFENAVRNVLPCPDPWGFGYIFNLRRPGSQQYQDAVMKTLLKNPVQCLYLQERLLTPAAAPPVGGIETAEPVNPVIELATAPLSDEAAKLAKKAEAAMKAAEEAAQLDRDFKAALKKHLDSGRINLADVFEANQDLEAALLIAAIHSVEKGGEVYGAGPDLEADLKALFSDDSEVPEGKLYEGEESGSALLKHLSKFMNGHAATRGTELEAAVKN